jgi:hypothetical protein
MHAGMLSAATLKYCTGHIRAYPACVPRAWPRQKAIWDRREIDPAYFMVSARCLLLARNCLDAEQSARQLCGVRQPAYCEMARQKLTDTVEKRQK